MWLAYMDESGNTGFRLDDPDQPIHWIAAVLVPEDHALALTLDVDRLVESSLGAVNATAELHGVEIFSGKGPWEGIRPDTRVSVYEKALELLSTRECVVAHASIDKTKLTRGTSNATSPHLLSLQFLVEKIELFLRSQVDPLRQRALLVADETDEHEAFAIELVDGLQRTGSGVVLGTKISRIVDNAHFVRSETNRGVQLADLVAYALNRNARSGGLSTRRGDAAIRQMLRRHVWPICRTYRATWPNK